MQRIEQLVRELETFDPPARTAAQELMAAVMELHGDALTSIVDALGTEPTRRLAADDVVRSVLLLYDLHPDDLQTRVRGALEKVRPYIESHGGRVALSRIESGVVHLELDGSCGGCPSSARTVKFAIEGAIFAAAPEVVEVIADSVQVAGEKEQWEIVGALDALGDGGGKTINISGRNLFFCRAGESYYAWAGSCPGCASPLEGSLIEASALLCAGCGRRFDMRAAGRAEGDPDLQLEPFPLLIDDGRARVAIPAGGDA
jgi:Fe-S cluster biogenesis protein NfuA/nitrite reductase/ring-hydroxylating ferredoxin subunit